MTAGSKQESTVTHISIQFATTASILLQHQLFIQLQATELQRMHQLSQALHKNLIVC